LLEKTTALRRQIAFELGIVVPGSRFKERPTLANGHYVIRLGEVSVGSGTVVAGHLLAVPADGKIDGFTGAPAREPIYGTAACWISPEHRAAAVERDAGVYDVASVMIIHLSEVVRHYAAELLGRQEVRYLLDFVARQQPDLVAAVTPSPLSLGEVRNVLQALLRERVSIRDLSSVLDAIADIAATTRSPLHLLAAARTALGRQIRATYSDSTGMLHVIVLEEALEERLLAAAHHVVERGENFETVRPPLDSDFTQNLVRAIADSRNRARNAGIGAVLVVHPAIRLFLNRLLEPVAPQPVLSWNEVLTRRSGGPRVQVREIISFARADSVDQVASE